MVQNHPPHETVSNTWRTENPHDDRQSDDQRRGPDRRHRLRRVLTKPLQLDLLLDRLREHLKIEWIYDEPVPTATPAHAPAVLPPEADLTKLRHLAQICAFTQLMEELNCLSQDQQYEPFANSLLQLLNTFQFDAILERLGPA